MKKILAISFLTMMVITSMAGAEESQIDWNSIDWKTIKSDSSALDAVREYVKKHGKLHCIETVPEGADQSEICTETDLYQPLPTIRKEVRTWEL